MAFSASELPPKVQTVFNNRDLDWNVLYWTARESGITDQNKLTNILFYKVHMELLYPGGSVPLSSDMKNYDALAAEWMKLKQLVQSLSYGSPAATKDKGWKPYTKSSLPDSENISPAVKDWLAETPKHRAEAGIFTSQRKDHGNNLYFLAWKTTDPAGKCISHDAHAASVLHGWFEIETSLTALKAKPADQKLLALMPKLPFGDSGDTGFLGIAAMNLFVNIRMVRHVFVAGQCLRNAESRAWRECKEDGVKDIQNAMGILGIAGGAKSASAKPAVANEAVLKASNVNWKGFVKQLDKIHRGEFGRGSNMRAMAGSVPVDREISGDDGSVVGFVRHFD